VVCELIDNRVVRTVLDFGCGNGEALLDFLSLKYKNIRFTGFDQDKQNSLLLSRLAERVRIANALHELSGDRYDVIILTEVLEHVDSPEEVISNLSTLLTDQGVFFITVPNGYGVSEWLSSLWGVFAQVFPRKKLGNDRFTMSSSPHINFFKLDHLHAIFSNTGVEVINSGNVVFMHAAPFRWLSSNWRFFGKANFSGLSRAPSKYADDWYFVLKRCHLSPSQTSRVFEPGLISRIRRLVNITRSRS
jgi:2-polyprenyl-3-methyl-5-hydroxy-6-metoxy-1,4-benzoquinol methylase